MPEWLHEFKKNFGDDRVSERRDSHASSSHVSFSEPPRSVDRGKHSVFYSFLQRPKLRESATGLKSQGLRAKDAMAEPSFVHKILVI